MAEEDSIPPERTSPERIGRYELCFELASGGMASVYLARLGGVSGFDKLVALKRIHPHLAKEKSYVDMFLDEARIASRITHPNVCSVFDFGEAEGEYYLAMEYLVGEPLSRLISRVVKSEKHRRAPLLPLRMARTIADACEGLHAAHELKDANGNLLHVVHRDVSPRNLFVTYDGAVQVVDFGIASARQRMHHTATGKVKGTFAYMAPEQLTAEPIDRRVDVWALGVTLWEMLTLKRLFRRDTTANTIHAVLYDEVVPPSGYRSQVPKELDEIVLKALQRNPKERWQTAREMGRALRHFLATQEAVIGPAELSEWIGEIFPQGEARKSQMMEIARMGDAAVPALPENHEADVTMTATGLQVAEEPIPSKPKISPGLGIGLLAAGVITVGVAFAMGLGETETASEGAPPMLAAASVPPAAVAEAIPAEPAREAQPPIVDGDKAAQTTPVTARQALDVESKDQRRQTVSRPRPKQRVKAQPGTINLVTRGGWAEVYKGGKSLGSTPRRLTLPAGRHKLVLKPFGDGKPKTVFVNVEANETKKVSIPLD